MAESPLTPSMERMLGKYTRLHYAARVNRTAKALEARGLVEWIGPHDVRDTGHWLLTSKGEIERLALTTLPGREAG